MYVEDIRKSNLCLSCEICDAVCPVDAVSMEYDSGQFLPKIDRDKCIDCGLCLKLCPGKVPESKRFSKDFEKALTGKYIETYSAFTKDWNILYGSTSGGTITRLILQLLEDERYAGAFVLNFHKFSGDPARLTLAKNKVDVKAASKSKYLPASVFNIIKTLEKETSPNYIIVGTPCQITGIKNHIRERDIDDDNLLFFGLFCDKTLSFNFLTYFENRFAKEDENVVNFDYRNKEKNGWPGDVKIYFDSGRELIVDRSERTKVKEYFQLERCLYCLDKLGREADISFGDCYIEGKDQPGRSNIIVRTKKGKEIWDDYKDIFEWETVSINSIQRSQNISLKRKNLEFRKILKGECSSEDSKKELSKIRKRIKLGREREFKKIERSTEGPDFETYKLMARSAWVIGKYVIKDTFYNPTKNSQDKRNVIILGGNLFNKGAQAMTFTVVDQVKRRFPDKKVYLFKSRDFDRDELEKQKYNFEIMPWDVLTRVNLLSDGKTFTEGESPYLRFYEETQKIFENAFLIVDISGYALSSQMGESDMRLPIKEYDYLLNIMVAKNYGIPFYILPQSIGPFDYPFSVKLILYPMMERYLKYPKKIFPREKHGVESISEFTQDNVEQASDIVLINDEYELENIFLDVELKHFEIPKNSVALVPNSKIMEKGEPDEIYSLYEMLIKEILSYGKKVYIIRHSPEDFEICMKIKDSFSSNDDVIWISEELNAVELEDMISKFDFIIGSRYHSIIHAYKNKIPALVLGWAVKYEELLKDFEQTEYHIDTREGFNKLKVIKKLRKLMEQYPSEKKVIGLKLNKIRQGETVFDKIFGKDTSQSM
ncbi:MAG: Coenzyme F420 hydrogenase/dehydrogenase, beta subunit C-terminal domain [Candidatus Saliniplasma sp.]